MIVWSLRGRDDAPDLVFHLGEDGLGLLDAHPGGRSHVQAHLARIHSREEVLPDHRNERKRSGSEHREKGQHRPAVIERPVEQAGVGGAHAVESLVHPEVQPPEKVVRVGPAAVTVPVYMSGSDRSMWCTMVGTSVRESR